MAVTKTRVKQKNREEFEKQTGASPDGDQSLLLKFLLAQIGKGKKKSTS
jgi:uncharacterized Fe-S cluster-containing radical SAM superfamily protein